MKKIILIFTLVLIRSLSLEASSPVRIEGVKNLGMGGAGSAFWSDYGVLYNPALLTHRKGFHIKLMDAPLAVSSDMFKFYEFVSDNQEDLENFDNLSQERQSELMSEIADTVTDYRMRINLGLAVPGLTMGPFPLPGPFGELNVGAGVYSAADIGMKMNPGILVPKINIWAKVDGVLSVPVATRIKRLPFNMPGEMSAGLGVKYIMRSRYEKNDSIMNLESFSVEPSDLEPGQGLGFDLGFVYDLSDELALSMVINDLFSTRLAYSDDSSEVITGSLSLGAAYKPFNSLKLAADIRGLESSDLTSATFFTKLYLGAEYSPLKIIALRGGLYQGYPTFGFGFLGFLNYAYYTREIGRYPGQIPEAMHTVSFSLGF